MFQAIDGEYYVKHMTLQQVGALTPPDYHTNPHVQALRQAILTAKARYGRVSNEGYSGLLHLVWMLRGQDAFTDFYEYPEETHHFIAVLEETLRRHLIFLKDTCGELAYFVLGSCKNCMISPQTYDEFFREPESRISTLSTYLMGRSTCHGHPSLRQKVR